MPKDLILVLVVGALSALMFVSVGLVSPLALALVFFAPLPLFVVGLRFGVNMAAIAVAVALLIVGLVSGVPTAIGYLLVTGLPTGLLVRQALLSRPDKDGVAWYPLGHLLVWLSGLGCAYFLIAFAIFLGNEGGLAGQIEALARAAMAVAIQAPGETDGDTFVAAAARMMPAVLAGAWAMMIVLNGALGQGLLMRLGRALRPRPHFAAMVLPRALAYALAAALVVSLLPGTLRFAGTTLAVILSIPYFFLGLTVIHAISSEWPLRGVLLGVIYIVTVLAGWPAALIAVLGLVEQWFGVRRRWAP